MNTYTAKIRWIRKGGDFAKGQYSRAHEGAFDGGAVVLGLDKLRNKQLENPWKKLDNIPL